jgi:antiviral helicase SKI2
MRGDTAFLPDGVRRLASAAAGKRGVVAGSSGSSQRPTGRPAASGPNAGRGGGGSGAPTPSYSAGRNVGAEQARRAIAAAGYGARGGQGGGGNSGQGAGGGADRSALLEMVAALRKRDLLPSALFCFSKKRCDAAADALSALDLTTSQEKHAAHAFFERCLSRLSEPDRRLPQVLRVRDLASRGVAVHHAGLLPILKEAVEMLFCSGYVKLLVCTETFAMGVNAPARCVIFHSLRKHDGRGFRALLPGEYTQMAGRAGRRGLDAVGTVWVACWDSAAVPTETELKGVLMGRGAPLASQFRLTYSMILNLLRVEDLKVEDMLRRSFAEFHAQRAQPGKQAALDLAQKRLRAYGNAPWPECARGCGRQQVEQYLRLLEREASLTSFLAGHVMGSAKASSLLVPGRVVQARVPGSGVTELAVVVGLVGAPLPEVVGGGGGGGGGESRGGGVGLARRGGDDDDDDLEGFYGGGGKGGGKGGKKGGGGKKGLAPLPAAAPLAALRSAAAASSSSSSAAAAAATAAAPDSAAGTGADRRLWLLVLHAPGPQDPPDAWRAIGGGGGGGGGGASAASAAAAPPPAGPLPRYGECPGVSGGGSWALVELRARDLVAICKARLQLSAQELDPRAVLSLPDARGVPAALRALARVRDEAPAASPSGSRRQQPEEMDPRADLRVADVDAVRALSERSAVLSGLRASPCHGCPGTPAQLALERSRLVLARRCRALERELSDQALSALPEFRQRLDLLASLGYVDPHDGTVTLKGRAACEVNSVQCELLATEAVFRGLLSGLEPAEVAALFSALVFQEKSDARPDLSSAPNLRAAAADLDALAREAARAQAACGLPVDEDEYARDKLHWGLAEAVLEWARGSAFSSVAALTDAPEGSIVRCVVRLDQAMRELQDCARVMGDTRLFAQARAASAAIKRDVVFSASLYIA